MNNIKQNIYSKLFKRKVKNDGDDDINISSSSTTSYNTNIIHTHNKEYLEDDRTLIVYGKQKQQYHHQMILNHRNRRKNQSMLYTISTSILSNWKICILCILAIRGLFHVILDFYKTIDTYILDLVVSLSNVQLVLLGFVISSGCLTVIFMYIVSMDNNHRYTRKRNSAIRNNSNNMLMDHGMNYNNRNHYYQENYRKRNMDKKWNVPQSQPQISGLTGLGQEEDLQQQSFYNKAHYKSSNNSTTSYSTSIRSTKAPECSMTSSITTPASLSPKKKSNMEGMVVNASVTNSPSSSLSSFETSSIVSSMDGGQSSFSSSTSTPISIKGLRRRNVAASYKPEQLQETTKDSFPAVPYLPDFHKKQDKASVVPTTSNYISAPDTIQELRQYSKMESQLSLPSTHDDTDDDDSKVTINSTATPVTTTSRKSIKSPRILALPVPKPLPELSKRSSKIYDKHQPPPPPPINLTNSNNSKVLQPLPPPPINLTNSNSSKVSSTIPISNWNLKLPPPPQILKRTNNTNSSNKDSIPTSITTKTTFSSSYSLSSSKKSSGTSKSKKSLSSKKSSSSTSNNVISFDHVKLQDVIGTGAFGRVHKAIWKGTPVAVKVISNMDTVINSSDEKQQYVQLLSEFALEIQMLSGMRHPNICLYIGACMTCPNYAIITELADNGSLWDALRNPLSNPTYREVCHDDGGVQLLWPNCTIDEIPNGTWPWKLILKVASGAARGMAYLHSSTPIILHRDLKSPNLLLDESYNAKVADFGLSRWKKENTKSNIASTAITGGGCGTIQWMAPEILASHRYAEPADVYSYGIILWELVTKKCPYDGMTPVQCVIAVMRDGKQVEIPTWCPSGFAHLVKQCINQDPTLRPTFDEILVLLDKMA